MKTSALLFLSLFFCFSAQSQNIGLDWVRATGGFSYDIGDHVITDSRNNVYTVGRFYDTVDFNPGPGTYLLNSNGSYDIFVQKLDSNGNFLWAKAIGSPGIEWVSGAIADHNDNFIFCGSYEGNMDIDPGPAVDMRTFNGIAGDMYVVKLDSSGNFLWGNTMGDTLSDRFTSIAVDASNNIVLSGLGFGSIDYDPGLSTNIISGGAGVFVQYDPNGNLNWVKAIYSNSANNEPYTSDIDIDENGDIIAIGIFQDTLDFDPGPNTYIMNTAPIDTEMFILKFDSLGNFVWAKQLDSDIYILSEEVETDNNNDIYIAGDLAGNVDFDPDPTAIYNMYTAGSAAFIAKYSATGSFIWAKKMGGTTGGWAHDIVHAVQVDTAGDLLLVGQFSGIEDFDPGPGVKMIESTQVSEETDAFIMKMTSTGDLVFVVDFGDSASEHAKAISIDQRGDFYVTGFFGNNNANQAAWHPTDFDPGAGVVGLLTNGATDCFLSKFNNCLPNSGIDVIDTCEPITWIDGNTYLSNNFTAQYRLTNVNGCDSFVTLNLTVNHIDTTLRLSQDTMISNESDANYQWIDCDNNILLMNENNQFFIPTTSGNYAVIITKNSCTDTSACTSSGIVGFREYWGNDLFTIYPNPSHSKVNIQTRYSGTLILMNQHGQVVLNENIEQAEQEIALSSLPSGLYFYQFSSEDGLQSTGKLAVQK